MGRNREGLRGRTLRRTRQGSVRALPQPCIRNHRQRLRTRPARGVRGPRPGDGPQGRHRSRDLRTRMTHGEQRHG
ncbi:hypothetical protein B4N89_27580 [Embleya scabrispora]|uniref:Uncharacterized protein n=1 Tax=Embleya scabrispora TaxID=159449 RepID=A0A1T3P532_9ACTN|nr:hypothetical protein B4N89_27580 [Embleya scabrispora]